MKKFIRLLSLALVITISTSACSNKSVNQNIKKTNQEAERIAKDLEKQEKELEDKAKKQKEIEEQKKNKVKQYEQEIENEKKIRKEEAAQGVTVSNNKDYDWYMDQNVTGKYHMDNCVPTCTAMILKFLDPNSNDTGESLRNEYLADGKGWIPDIMLDALKKRNIKYVTYNFKRGNMSDMPIRKYVKDGYIGMFFADMTKISGARNNPSTIGKSHNDPQVVRHTFIVKGYKYINNELYFEVYDPDSGSRKYKNGQLVGKDRYYKASEVTNAIVWPNILFFKSK